MPRRIEKTVFISYRRANAPWALAIFQNLTVHEYNVFFDYMSINSGDFEQILIQNIRARAHFLILLTPSALERCDDPGDWLRREIEVALDEERNIVPIFLEGFNFSSPAIASKLTGKLASLNRYNGLNVPVDYFWEAMDRLRTRYLNVSLDMVLHPVTTNVARTVQSQQTFARQARQVEERQLTAQQWYEKGKSFSTDRKLEDAVHAFEKATELDMDLTDAWENKSQLLIRLGRKKEASESISQLIGLYEKQIEIAEVQYNTSRDAWTSQAENDRLFGNQSISMSDYYDSEVLASHRGYTEVDTKLRDKVRSLKILLASIQPRE
jgi:tetratricopeptide (TPR) repeat protein